MGRSINPKSSFQKSNFIRRRGTAFPRGKAVALLFVCFFIVPLLAACGEDRALTLVREGGADVAQGGAASSVAGGTVGGAGGQDLVSGGASGVASGGGSALGSGTAGAVSGSASGDGGVGAASDMEIFVHVCGAVATPGLYGLPLGSRAADALLLAGGFTEDADISYVNLAAFLEDGQQLYFPTKEERLSEDQPSLININTADEEALKKLPGIGESRASAILKYRKEHGAFASTQDLLSVPGISETTWEQFKDLITVR